MNHRKKTAVLLIICVLGFLVVSIQPAKAQFVIAEWDEPDEYGQGIYSITPDENSSGYWAHIESSPGFLYANSENDTFSIDQGISIRLDVRVLVNYTFLGVSEVEALDLIRLNITVTVLNNITYSIQNMTYNSVGGDLGNGVWWYSFVDILNFLTVNSLVYAVTVTYEVFY